MAGPTVPKIRLGWALRRARERAGLRREDVAHVLDCSTAKVGYIEQGRSAVTRRDLGEMVTAYGITDRDELVRLERLRWLGAQPAWFSTLKVSERTARYLGLEAEAETLRCVEVAELLPGILQTENYVRRLYALSGSNPSDDHIIERQVRVRMHRQQRLTEEPDPLRVSAVITLGALERCAADDPVMAAEQFSYLISRGQLPNVELLVLPFSTGLHTVASGFTLMTFPEVDDTGQPALPDQVWEESVTGGHVVVDPMKVADLATLFDRLRGQALDPNKSLAKIAEFR